MDKNLKALFDQLDDMVIALNSVPSFKAVTPEITRLRKELGKLATIRNAIKRQSNVKIQKVTTIKSMPSKPDFWNAFDGFMSSERNPGER